MTSVKYALCPSSRTPKCNDHFMRPRSLGSPSVEKLHRSRSGQAHTGPGPRYPRATAVTSPGAERKSEGQICHTPASAVTGARADRAWRAPAVNPWTDSPPAEGSRSGARGTDLGPCWAFADCTTKLPWTGTGVSLPAAGPVSSSEAGDTGSEDKRTRFRSAIREETARQSRFIRDA